MIGSQRLRVFGTILLVVLATLMIFYIDLPPEIISAILLLFLVVGLLRRLRRRSMLQSAVCPRDGHPLDVRFKQWGARGSPLLQCPLDRNSYYVSSWSPFDVTKVDLDAA